MKPEDKVLTYAKAFAVFSLGCLAIACVVPVLEIKDLQLSEIVWNRCDAVRQLALASKYENQEGIKKLAALAVDM